MVALACRSRAMAEWKNCLWYSTLIWRIRTSHNCILSPPHSHLPVVVESCRAALVDVFIRVRKHTSPAESHITRIRQCCQCYVPLFAITPIREEIILQLAKRILSAGGGPSRDRRVDHVQHRGRKARPSASILYSNHSCQGTGRSLRHLRRPLRP